MEHSLLYRLKKMGYLSSYRIYDFKLPGHKNNKDRYIAWFYRHLVDEFRFFLSGKDSFKKAINNIFHYEFDKYLKPNVFEVIDTNERQVIVLFDVDYMDFLVDDLDESVILKNKRFIESDSKNYKDDKYWSLLDALEKASDYEVSKYYFILDDIIAEFNINKLRNIAPDMSDLKDIILFDLNDLNANITEKDIEILNVNKDTVEVKFL